MKKEDYIDDECKHGFSSNFMKSLGSQLGNMFGFGSAIEHSGLDANAALLEKIIDLQTELENIEWQCSQKIILAQDDTNKERVEEFYNLQNYLNENMVYVQNKYIFEEERLGILEGAISVMTSLVVVVILYFLKFN